MSSSSDSAILSKERLSMQAGAGAAERRADIERKQGQIAALLAEVECEGLLLLEPENVAWFTSGLTPRNVLDPQQQPGLLLLSDARSVLASNVDTQRLFEEELDTLGFQLKEWSWHLGREQLLAYLCRGRKLACDRPLGECKLVSNQLRHLRRTISDYELAGYRELGRILSHALEATCRSLMPRQTEEEIAGHLSHRVLKHGAELIAVEVAADDRLRRFRRPAFTPTPVQRQCVLSATARRAGLYATASRTVAFGALDATWQKEHDTACKVTASCIAGSMPHAVPSNLLQTARRVYQINQYEHEWRLAPAGFLTGRAPVELLLTPQCTEPLQPGWAITWRAGVGAALSCDTFVITPQGPVLLTTPGNWPKKRIKIQATDYDRPDILQRE